MLMVVGLLFRDTRVENAQTSGSESTGFFFGPFDVEDLVVICFPPLISDI